MRTRALTGRVITPDGVGITSGVVVVTPVAPYPATEGMGVLAPAKAEYEIIDGLINGSIVAPAVYKFEVLQNGVPIWVFFRGVADVATPISLQELYLEDATPPAIDPAYIREGDSVLLLSAGTAPSGQVLTSLGAGVMGWSGAGAGDMTKAVYDPDDNGKVTAAAAADAVPWSGVTGKPSTFTPASHASSHASGGGDAITPADIGAAATSHSHAAGDVTSGQLAAARGGTGVDSSAWTGVPKVASGVWQSGATASDVAAIPVTAAVVSVSSSRNIASTDAGKILECNGTITLTGDNSLPAGTQVTVVNVGTGTVTLAATTLRSRGGRNNLSQQWAAATMYHRGSGEWVTAGDLST